VSDDRLTLIVRRGSAADAEPLARLAARTFADAFGADNTPEDLAAHLAASYGVPQQTAELRDPAIVTLIVDSEDGFAAYAQLRRHRPPACVAGDNPLEVWRFYVDRRWHGEGVAHRLMDAVRAAARELGAATLWLGVWERNARAIRFYEKCGFRAAGSQPFWVGSDKQNDLVMVAGVAPPHV
jgi:GNAT superfamily N-acetyltransferase